MKPSSGNREGRGGMPTRDLMACAAVGVACGLLTVPVVYLQVGIALTAPIAYTVFTGVFIAAPVIAQALVRRPGAALMAAVVAALASAPVSPRGILAIGPMALLGIVYELFALSGKYRTWPTWRWFAASALLSGFAIATMTAAFDLLSLSPVMAALTIASIPASYLVGTLIFLRLARALERRVPGFGAPQIPQHQHYGFAGEDSSVHVNASDSEA